MNHFIGIDLGTTNSAVAYLDEIGKPHLITLDDGERLLPSAVFVDPGEKGISLINVGSSARRRAESHPERVAMHFKRIIGNKEVNPIEISGKRISATSFSALILNKLRQAAGTHLGAAPMSAIITVPATFSEAAREATRNAATKAGFDSVELINEPTAAILLASSLPNLMIDGTVLVFDLGGGTFDATLASVNGQEISVIWSEGDRHLGGINFDEKILKVIAGHGPQFTGVNIPHNNLLAEQIKKRFGVENQVDHFLYSDSSCSNRVNCTIRREEFEIAAAPLMQRVMQLVDTVLDNEKQPMEPHEVDHILLVGGSTRMPLVHQYLKEFFGKEPISAPNVDEAVVLGAAIKAGISAGPDKMNAAQAASLANSALTDVVSQYLGTIALDHGGLANVIMIKKGAAIPATIEEPFSLLHDGQETIRCRLTQSGHSEDDPDFVEVLKEQNFQLPEGAKLGDAIQVSYTVNDSNQVSCRFTHERSGRHVEFTHCFGGAEGVGEDNVDLSDLLID